jgi:hypothetical protein
MTKKQSAERAVRLSSIAEISMNAPSERGFRFRRERRSLP